MSLRHLLAGLSLASLAVLGVGLYTGLLWAGVALSALAVLLALSLAWVEHLAAQRRHIALDAWEARLGALEQSNAALQAEVDTLTRERALSRM